VTVSDSIGLAYVNLKIRETLRYQSIRDPLTGLFNRRYLEETLARELSRVSRNQNPLSLIMVDIDYFKNFNDSFGHVMGDILLKKLGQLFIHSLREEDIACRYGGDEFIIVLPDTTLDNAKRWAERLRENVKNLNIISSWDAESGIITLSFGIAAYSEKANSIDNLIRIADKALYSSKSLGRDQVVVGESL
jgi:diguanylate cyclase (GGDEF)-like protein